MITDCGDGVEIHLGSGCDREPVWKAALVMVVKALELPVASLKPREDPASSREEENIYFTKRKLKV